MMLLPALAYGVARWLERGSRAAWVGLAFGCAALILMHPVAALLGYGALGIALLCGVLATRSWRRPIWAGVALLVGAGVAAFFWLSVALEWPLVQGDMAVSGPFQYFLHFVAPQALLGLPGPAALIQVDLGVPFLSLIGLSTVLLVANARSVTRPQWCLVATLWLLAAISVFMMSAASGPVWAALPLLQRVQFPWRFLLLLTVAGGALLGCTPVLRRSVTALGLAWLVWHWGLGQTLRTDQYVMPVTSAEIATRFVRPDVMNEWLPRAATVIDPTRDPSVGRVECAPPCATATFTRAPGRLEVRIDGASPTTVTLPHYAFPVGWTLLVDGRNEPRRVLSPDAKGLMRVLAHPGERIELVFTTTPGRRLGAKVSAASVLLLLAIAWRALPRSEPDAPVA